MNTKYSLYQQAPLLVLFILFSFSNNLNAQIIIGEEEEESSEKNEKKDEKKDKEEITNDSLSGSTYYLTGMMNYGHRSFRDESVYGSYADWNEQMPDYSGGVTLGVIFPLDKGFSLDIGVTYFGHKEQFSYEDTLTDSTYSYSNTYMQLGVPIKLRYTIGDKFQFFGFAGVTPLNILNIRFNEKYNRANGTLVEPEVEVVSEKLAIFNIMANVGVGVSYSFKRIGFTLYPEYRHYLLNTYNSQRPIYHRMFGLGIHAGLTLKI